MELTREYLENKRSLDLACHLGAGEPFPEKQLFFFHHLLHQGEGFIVTSLPCSHCACGTPCTILRA